MTLRFALPGAVLAILTICGWLWFPGHTFLQSDTQIYMPILEHLRDPALYPSDPVALRPHVAFTIYDETARAIRAITGQPFQFALVLQQVLTRFCGLIGMFLLATAAGLSTRMALLTASLYGLGATIAGPAVLIFEYEPVPRGYAVPLLVLAIGLVLHDRWRAGAIAAGAAVLYHPPTTAPVLLALLLLAWRRGRLRDLWPIAAAAALTFVLSRLQSGIVEHQEFLSTVDAELERLQRLRGSYNWISLWGVPWLRHYELMAALLAIAFARVRDSLPPNLRFLTAALAVYGMISIPAAYILLERWKWSLMSQFQPARAVLFVVMLTVVMAVLAGIRAARSATNWGTAESIGWFLVAFAIPAQAEAQLLLFPDLRGAVMRDRFLSVLLLAVLAWLAARCEIRRPAPSAAALAAALLLPFWLMPGPAKVRNYPDLDHPEIHELAAWAQANTPVDAVFQFPDAGRGLTPGLFRVWALRTVYTDWKSGGQVNLLKEFATEWWDRWEKAGGDKYDPAHAEQRLAALSALGIDYAVLDPRHAIAARSPAYRNGKYVVYRIR
ncbi:MAG: DUF6798 domain-containing protein [Bryobacteraceae bacterium]